MSPSSATPISSPTSSGSCMVSTGLSRSTCAVGDRQCRSRPASRDHEVAGTCVVARQCALGGLIEEICHPIRDGEDGAGEPPERERSTSRDSAQGIDGEDVRGGDQPALTVDAIDREAAVLDERAQPLLGPPPEVSGVRVIGPDTVGREEQASISPQDAVRLSQHASRIVYMLELLRGDHQICRSPTKGAGLRTTQDVRLAVGGNEVKAYVAAWEQRSVWSIAAAEVYHPSRVERR
jgi:hypothetical protein